MEEIEAESVAYSVCAYYGIETDANSFGYLANYTQGKSIAELKASLDLIAKTADELITDIDRHYAEIMAERGVAEITAEIKELLPDPLVPIEVMHRYFERGNGLISTNNNNITVEFKASELEKELITTDRRELKEIVDRARREAQDEQTE